MNERMHSDGRRVSGDHYHHDTHPSIHSPIQEDVDRNHPQPSDSRRKVPTEIDKMKDNKEDIDHLTLYACKINRTGKVSTRCICEKNIFNHYY